MSADTDLAVNGPYTVTGNETWRDVLVGDQGTLRVPAGSRLTCRAIDLEGACVIDACGGAIAIVSKTTHVSLVGMWGTCSYLNLSGGAHLNITAPDGFPDMALSRGGSALLRVTATMGINVTDSRIDVQAGRGTSPENPWSRGALSGFVSAGGDAECEMNLTSPTATLLCANSTIRVQAGGGGDAPDGAEPSGNTKGRGGGFSSGGEVSGSVGSGGSASCSLASRRMNLSSTTVSVLGGAGGAAGKGGDCDNTGQAGAGGGGYTGGDGAGGLAEDDWHRGGYVKDRVGSGGDADLEMTGWEVELLGSAMSVRAGDGGDAGDAGVAYAEGGSGGGGYSGGGGGSYCHCKGGDGGTVSGDVGTGGRASMSLDFQDAVWVEGSALVVTAGAGGAAGDGGTPVYSGGAGGGGYSGGGGGGEGAANGAGPGQDGGMGGPVMGNVGHGGEALLRASCPRLVVLGTEMRALGGNGGDGGLAGSNHTHRSDDTGGGGGGYSAGGGGGEGNQARESGAGGLASSVSGNVSDGGMATLVMSSARPTIDRASTALAVGGIGGNGTSSSAPAPTGGEGRGRATSSGSAGRTIPMSVPILLSPPDGRTIPTRTPRLSWTPVMDSTTNGDVQEYRVEIDKDPGFSMPQRWAGGNESTVWSVPLSVGIYRWRASAIYEMPADSTAGWSDIFTFVTRENSPPQAVGLPDEVRIDEDTVDEPILDLGETFIDEDGDELELSIIGTVNISVTLRGDGVALATPVPDFFGSEEVTLVALERYGIEPVLVLLRITVANLNDPPRINATPATSVDEDALYWSPFMAVHPDPPEDVVSWAVETSAAFLTMDPSSGALSGTPLNDDVGLHDVTVIATDASGSSDRLDFTLEVVDVNDPPMIVTVPVLECRQDEPYSVQFEAVDVDPTNDTVRWELGDGPRFLSMVSYSGLLSGIPGQDDVGSHLVEIIARDDRGAMDLVSFTLIVTDVNDPPRVRDIGPLFLMADILNTLDIADYVSDDETPDGELVVTIDHPAVAGVDGTTIALLWPTNGDFDITIRVSDGCSTVEGRLMVHFIGGENGPPRIIAIDGLDPPFVLTLDRGGTRAFKIDVVDDEGDTYNISVTSSWWGVSLEKHDMLRATSSGWDVGEHLVVIWVVDERMNAARYEATVNVVIKNSPPAVPIIESPLDGSTFRESEEISFSVVVDDPDVRYGQTLWVNWSSSISGPFMRTDSGLNVFKRDLPPGTHTITVEVSDGEFSRNASVTITITRSHIVGQGAWAVLVVLAIIATVAVCVVVWRRMLFGRPPRQGGVGPGDQVPSPPSQGSTGPWEQIR